MERRNSTNPFPRVQRILGRDKHDAVAFGSHCTEPTIYHKVTVGGVPGLHDIRICIENNLRWRENE